MILKAFAVCDLKADIFNSPFFFPAIGQAVRAFADLANDNQSSVSRHPEDYKLFHIGEYDDQTGILTSITPAPLGVASEYVSSGGKVIGAIPRKE